MTITNRTDDTTTGPLSSDDDRETRTPDLAQVVRSVKDAYLPRNHAARTTRKDGR